MNLDQLDADIASNIIERLSAGEVINRRIYSQEEGALTDSQQFNEVMNNLETYQQYFLLNRAHLKVLDQRCVFLADQAFEDTLQAGAARIYTLLLMTFKGMDDMGRDLKHLLDPAVGVAASIFKEIGEHKDNQVILKAAGLKLDLLSNIDSLLLKKAIMQQNSRNYYFLSDAGLALYDSLMTTECEG